MPKIILTIICIFIYSAGFGQVSENEKLIELGKAYKDFMFRNEPPKNFVKNLSTEIPENLKTAKDFIIQTITTNSKILSKDYLKLPDEPTLKSIYIIRAVNHNIHDEIPMDNAKLVDSLQSKVIPRYELIDSYYSMLFATVGNKITPFDLSKTNFKLSDYNLKDETEKGIFFLRCMEYCGKTIWGFMNVLKPPNTQKAYDYIKKFPKFNDLKYFQFNDLDFPDFEMQIYKNRGIESYKSYFIDKYYETLIYHLICLNKEGGSEKEIYDLMLGSILKEKKLYKYTKNKTLLEEMFKEQKN